MRSLNTVNESDEARERRTPSRCPACGSTDVKTSSKIVTDDCYWRCESCRDVWNVGRRRAAGRSRGRFIR